MHDTSLEEQRYLSSVRYETEAFDALIRAKQHMAMPAEQEGRVNGGVGIPPNAIRTPPTRTTPSSTSPAAAFACRTARTTDCGPWMDRTPPRLCSPST